VATPIEQLRPADRPEQARPRLNGGTHQRRQMLRVFAAPKRCCRKPANPSRHAQGLAWGEVERSAEAEKLAIESEQQPRRGQRLHQFLCDMARIAEARAGNARFIAIEQ
jgi:hypothetical protein